jgi:hypothetical protein
LRPPAFSRDDLRPPLFPIHRQSEKRPRSSKMADQPNRNPADAGRSESPQKPADTDKAGGKIDSRTEKAQEEAAKDRAREGGYQ